MVGDARRTVRILVVAAACHAASAFQPPVSSVAGLQLRPRVPLMMAKKRIPVLDDVLDYLTNMGGYTGFSEDQLKGDGPLSDVDTENFGVELETDDTVTTIFVVVLIMVPFIVGFIAFKLRLLQMPRFIPS